MDKLGLLVMRSGTTVRYEAFWLLGAQEASYRSMTKAAGVTEEMDEEETSGAGRLKESTLQCCVRFEEIIG